jgi:UDP-GlcNAc:undecaprenyl-phosphate GlcNAc-1-phosphate transferase
MNLALDWGGVNQMLTYSFTSLALLSAFFISILCVPLATQLARNLGAIDPPDERKVHKVEMPRLGGLAIFAAFMLSVIIFTRITGPMLGLVLGAIIIFLVGAADDIYHLSPLVKLIGQSLAAGLAMYYGVMVQFVTNPFDGMLILGYLSIPLTFLWIVGITNAINLIDGLDGLAGGVSAIAATALGIVALRQGQIDVALAAMLLVAAIIGFLPYNFHPARTFMGDSGSNFLGFVLACLAIMGTAKGAALLSLLIPIIILGIPIFDTFFAIVRRISNHKPIFLPDKDHLHHRLMALGLSHRRSVFIIYGISAFFSGIAVLLTFVTSPKASLLLSLLLLFIVLGADRIGLLTGRSSSSRSTSSRSIDL